MTVHDEALATRVDSALKSDKRIGGLPIDTYVSGGDVFLRGKVESAEQAAVAEFIASGVPGVRHVDTKELEILEARR